MDQQQQVQLYSQARQDEWIIHLFNGKRKGTFADIGAGHPSVGSNTFALEQGLDWNGLLCDIEWAKELAMNRPQHIYADAFSVDWLHALRQIATYKRVDYLSLDLEPPHLTLALLVILPLEHIRFNAITIEHDAYRGYSAGRLAMRSLLIDYGYVCVAPDVEAVCPDGTKVAFEDWWVDPTTMDVELAKRLALEVCNES